MYNHIKIGKSDFTTKLEHNWFWYQTGGEPLLRLNPKDLSISKKSTNEGFTGVLCDDSISIKSSKKYEQKTGQQRVPDCIGWYFWACFEIHNTTLLVLIPMDYPVCIPIICILWAIALHLCSTNTSKEESYPCSYVSDIDTPIHIRYFFWCI